MNSFNKYFKSTRAFIFCSFVSCVLFFSCIPFAFCEEVAYDLFIEYKNVNFTGKTVKAISINNQIPGPTLYWQEGDTAKIRVHNRLDEETSIHWHGILLPNKEDGVSYLTTPPIKPGTTREFVFQIKQSGTYWYHSHTNLQEQLGVYGAIVIYPKDWKIPADKEYVLVISDWTDDDPHEVLRTLKRGSDYYLLKKGVVQSLYGAIKNSALTDVFKRSLMRMPPMDISDVAYDLFLMNGKNELLIPAKPQEKILLRIINASSATYFYLRYAGGKMTIISADGQDVTPFEIDTFLIAIGETYDVVITVPGEGLFEFKATAQDVSGSVSAFIGEGNYFRAPLIPKPNLYKMHLDEHTMEETQNEKHGHGHDHYTQDTHHEDEKIEKNPATPYRHLRALTPTTLNPSNPTRTITLTLDGDMERFVWTINGKILSESDPIIVKRGENVRIIFENKSMMHHPMHLHGHFFRVINEQGEYAPLKHTVDISPMGRQIIEFYAGEEKDWPLHCHILYHMKAGMFTVISYEGSQIDPEIEEARKSPSNDLKKDHWYLWGEASILTQMSEGFITASNTRNIITGSWKADWESSYDIELTYDRYIDRYLKLLVGTNIREEKSPFILGLRYLIPLNFETKFWIDSEGEVKAHIENKLPLTNRLNMALSIEYYTFSGWEWLVKATWTINKYFSLTGSYHKDYKGGVGLTLKF